MKVLGWILLVLGIFAFIGQLISGQFFAGSFIWIVIGGYLISRANKKEEEKKEKEKWLNDKLDTDEKNS